MWNQGARVDEWGRRSINYCPIWGELVALQQSKLGRLGLSW